MLKLAKFGLKFSWVLVVILLAGPSVGRVRAATSSSGAVGIEGTISTPPPSTGATISLPRDGAVFDNIPITVSGLCSGDVLVKLFKNNVFAGSVQCQNGSFSLSSDLFAGRNELLARVFDALDQAGPDSNVVAVEYNQPAAGAASRPSLTSVFAKKGANPGETITWPIILSGGEGPYAVSVDWGDGKPPDLSSIQFAGSFNIQHAYEKPGVYNIIVKVGDKNGQVAFLQLVGVANGALSQDNSVTGNASRGKLTGGSGQASANANLDAPKVKILWQPAAVVLPFLASTFWLGKRYELLALRRKIEKGNRPFK